MSRSFPAAVAKIIDDCTLVINRGSEDNVPFGQRFLIYRQSEEQILDPVTGEFLGNLEIVRGTGKVIHVQDRISTVESDEREPPKRRIVRGPSAIPFILPGHDETIVVPGQLKPFHEPEVGDLAKRI
jgi:hypothetical protein